MKRKLLWVFLTLTTLIGTAQTCTQRLVQAERDYEAGRLAGIPDNIGACFGNQAGDFSKEEKIRAYRLLTLVHIFTDNEPEAERSLINLLKVDKEHQLDARVDPAELRLLYERFQTKPIFRLGFRGGVNTTFPQVQERHTASDANVDNKFYNGSGSGSVEGQSAQGTRKYGFQGEVTYERYFSKGLEAVGGLHVRYSSYDVDNFFNDPNFNNTVTNSQLYLRVPVMGRYTWNYDSRNGLQPYVFLGGSYDLLLSATYTNASRRGGTPFTLAEDINPLENDQINRHNVSLITGVGIRFPLGTNFFTAEVRYDKSFINYVDPDNRHADQRLSFDLGHIEDDLTLDFLSVNIGYTLSIYNPKRIEN